MSGRPPDEEWPADSRAILHVDMDAFFVSVELLRRPELRGKPVIVGGSGDRGVVAAASYEARSYGIFSAMPSAQARRLCPRAVFLPGDHPRYAEVSRRVMAQFHSVTPLVEPISLDEAFLDVTGARRVSGDPIAVAHLLRESVYAAEGLRCSVGLAATKFVAKLASADAKPRVGPQGPQEGPGLVPIWPGEETAYLHPLPVSRLWGVGPATLGRLQRIGVATIGDLAALPLSAVVTSLGRASGRHLHALAQGLDDRPVVVDHDAKSIGHEETFAHDRHDHEALDREILRLADSVAGRLRATGRLGRTVTVKVKFADFRTITRSSTPVAPIDTSHAIASQARSLLAGIDPTPGVRLLGISLGNLTVGGRQLSFDDEDEGWETAEQTVEQIRGRFGHGAIGPAALLGQSGLDRRHAGDQQWGPDRGASDPDAL